MPRYLARRALVSLLVLLAASALMYVLVDLSGDPLSDLRTSSAPNRDQLIASRTALLGLDDPLAVRYLRWLGGAAGCLVAFLPGVSCDLGVSLQDLTVTETLVTTLPATLQLVLAAMVVAVLVGVAVGVAAALRAGGVFDHVSGGVSLVFFSLPVFWVAVLLKEYLAIGVNDFLAEPVVPPVVIGVLAVLAGLLVAGVAGRRRVLAFLVGGGVCAVLLWATGASGWWLRPSLGPVAVGLGVVAIGLAVAAWSGELTRRGGAGARRGAGALRGADALRGAAGAVVLVVAVLVVWEVGGAAQRATAPGLWAMLLGGTAAGAGLGWMVAGDDRPRGARAGGLTAGLGVGLLLLDGFARRWPDYLADPLVRGRPVATVGSSTPALTGDVWIEGIDTAMHLLLPATALVLVSVAAYVRFTRASMIETLGEEHLTAARAAGVPEHRVVLRHALRNALVPVVTVTAVDLGAVVGGTVVVEKVFGWSGMGSMFVDALSAPLDPAPVMAFFLVTGVAVVVFGLLADVVHGWLDPRVAVAG